MDLSIIIVSWNTKKLLDECLHSVYRHPTSYNFEVIVVDNHSGDGSDEMVRAKYPQAKLLVNDSNLGFARANNVAFPLAQGKFVLLLNSDTTVLPNLIEAALARLDGNSRIGALAPRIYNADGSVQHPCYVSYPSLLSEVLDVFYMTKFFRNFNRFGRFIDADYKCRPVQHATGACLFIRRDVLNDVGYLDSSLIFSYEDADLCRRIRESGFDIVYEPAAEVIHYGGASTGLLIDKGVAVVFISKYRYFLKYHGRLYVLALAFMTISSAIAKVAFVTLFGGLKQGLSKSRQKAIISYYKNVFKWHFSPSFRGLFGSSTSTIA